MKKRILILVAVALVATFGFALAAEAGGFDIEGTGILTAQGDGLAFLHGGGKIDLSGAGTLWIRDIAGDATIEVEGGEYKEFPDGWIQYGRFEGTAHIEGSKISVLMVGVDIELTASGTGYARLRGHGTYDLNGMTGEWGMRGTVLRLGE